MVRESVDLLELLRKQAAGGDLDFLREAVAVLAEAVMEAEVAAQIGAGHGERSPERITRRNGYRPRRWDTRAGSIELQIPKLRQGSYFPALLEPRRRAERALLSVVQQAYVEGVSTRRVDDLVRSLGCEGISKSSVSRICSELYAVVSSFLERPLDGGPYRYLWLDALTQRVREEGRIAQVSVVVATAVNADGKREVLSSRASTVLIAAVRARCGRPLALGDQWRESGQPVREELTEGAVRELRGAEYVGDPLPAREGIRGRDAAALRAGRQLVDAAPLVDDEAEALGDLAAQALRPRWPSAVKVVPERVCRGRSAAARGQRRHDREPVGEEFPELAVDEGRRPEDVGDIDALVQGVEGHDVPALRAGDQLLDAAPLEDDEAEALRDRAAQAVRPGGSRAGSHATSGKLTR